MAHSLETDVVIVGAGPTGLMLANCLARLGIGAVVLDSKSEPTRESRALVLQARTMEIFDQLGLIDRVLDEATIAGSIRPGFEKTAFGKITFSTLGSTVTPYPQLYVLEQSKNERILVDGLRDLGREVLWGHAFDAIEARADGGIRVSSRTAAGEAVTIDARYCVGTDGSGSAVRESRGIPFEGRTNEHTFYVLDAVGVRGIDLESINGRFGQRHFLLTFPMGSGDHERLIGVVRNPTGAAVLEPAVRDTLEQVFAVSYDRSLWFSTYRVHHRVARHFRDGAVFLAGDAAHVHSPVGAQGMNTGLQDAHNLACKLADVIAGRAPTTYLDRYEAERRPVALRLVSTTDTVFGVVTSERRRARLFRRWVARFIAPVAASFVPKLAGAPRIFEYLSQTRIHYWMSPRAKRDAHGHRGTVVGRRLPWNGDNFESLRAMTWQVHAYGMPSDVTVGLDASLGLPVTAFANIRNRKLDSERLYLVRPDGFVAAAAAPRDAARVFAEALGRAG